MRIVLFLIFSCWIGLIAGCEQNQETENSPTPSVTLMKAPDPQFSYVMLSKKAADSIGLQLVLLKNYGTSNAVIAKQIPYSAIIYGLHGETWVYILVKPLTFVRTPVMINHVVGDIAILAKGIPSDSVIVAIGATELYGSEYIGYIQP